jgi:EmrB/QacA subfamily drug resistance transporter
MTSITALVDAPVATSRRLILGLVLVAQFMVVLDTTIVTVALPSIQSSLDFGSQTSLQWVLNAYILLFGGFLLLGGRAGDLYGRRTLFVLGLTLFTAASLLSGLAQSSEVLIAGRAAQGLGAALVAPAVLSIIVATFTDSAERARALGVFTAVTASGASAGFVLGGILTDVLSWRWIFFVNIPIGIAGVLLALRYVPNSRAGDGSSRSLDVPGAVTVTGGVGLLIYGVVNAQSWGWGSTRFILTAAGAAFLLLAFLVVELRAHAPLVRLGIFKLRSLSAANATMLLFVSGQFATLFFPTLYMAGVLGYGPIESGLAWLPWPLAFTAASMLAQRLIPRFGARPTLVSGLAVGALGLVLISQMSSDGSYAADLLPGFLVNAAGAGLVYPTLFLAATARVRGDEVGLASGLINTSLQIGSAIGLAALATVAASRTSDVLGGDGSPGAETNALVEGWQRGIFVGALLLIAAGVVAILTLRRHDLDQAPEATPAVETAALPAQSIDGARPGEILIAFDGSENARHAIRVAGRELGGGRAAVVHVWEPLTGDGPLVPSALASGAGEAEIELEAERALATAEEGASLARAAGFDSEAYALRTDGSIGEAIVDYVNRHGTRLVVVGTRGLSGVRSALAGSVTNHVTHNVLVPVLAVPPEDGRV